MQRFVILLSSFAILHAAFSAPAERPNVIVIMADDLGYGDLSCYGATALSTPNMDRLAAEGARFTQGYCSASTCTPTRYSLLTGTYAFRNKGTGIAGPNSPLIIPEDTLTLPDVMKSAGYKTAVIGKWHLGLGGAAGPQWNGELKPGPSELGFDDHFILPTTNDRVPQVFVEAAHVLNLDAKDPLWVGDKQPSPDHPTGISQRTTLKMNWSHGHNGTIHNGISRIGFYTGGQAARFRDEERSLSPDPRRESPTLSAFARTHTSTATRCRIDPRRDADSPPGSAIAARCEPRPGQSRVLVGVVPRREAPRFHRDDAARHDRHVELNRAYVGSRNTG